MSFNISGYSEFVFEIKNDSEQNYDYVVVGVNQYPTHSSMYNAKGYNGWKRIRLKNLDRTKSYTIYVTYSKDGSNHHGKDRGYVKIPQNN